MEKHIDTTWGSEFLNGKENHGSYDVSRMRSLGMADKNQSYQFYFGFCTSDWRSFVGTVVAVACRLQKQPPPSMRLSIQGF